MDSICKIQVGNSSESTYRDYNINEEFRKRVDETEEADPVLENAKITDGIGWVEISNDTVISYEGDISTTESYGSNYVTMPTTELQFYPTYVYNITFDGSDYVCKPKVNGYLQITVGNENITDQNAIDTGEPFCIVQYEDYVTINTRIPGTYHMSVSMRPSTIHEIDSKYFSNSADIVINLSTSPISKVNASDIISIKGHIHDVPSMIASGRVPNIIVNYMYGRYALSCKVQTVNVYCEHVYLYYTYAYESKIYISYIDLINDNEFNDSFLKYVQGTNLT